LKEKSSLVAVTGSWLVGAEWFQLHWMKAGRSSWMVEAGWLKGGRSLQVRPVVEAAWSQPVVEGLLSGLVEAVSTDWSMNSALVEGWSKQASGRSF
jgi:hypothetical protein